MKKSELRFARRKYRSASLRFRTSSSRTLSDSHLTASRGDGSLGETSDAFKIGAH
jgi:hypothetical protein